MAEMVTVLVIIAVILVVAIACVFIYDFVFHAGISFNICKAASVFIVKAIGISLFGAEEGAVAPVCYNFPH